MSPKGKNFRKHYNCRLCLTFARITNSFIVCHCCGKYIYGDTKTCQSFLLLGELLSFKYQMKLNFLLIFFDLRILNNPLVSSNTSYRIELYFLKEHQFTLYVLFLLGIVLLAADCIFCFTSNFILLCLLHLYLIVFNRCYCLYQCSKIL